MEEKLREYVKLGDTMLEPVKDKYYVGKLALYIDDIIRFIRVPEFHKDVLEKSSHFLGLMEDYIKKNFIIGKGVDNDFFISVKDEMNKVNEADLYQWFTDNRIDILNNEVKGLLKNDKLLMRPHKLTRSSRSVQMARKISNTVNYFIKMGGNKGSFKDLLEYADTLEEFLEFLNDR